MTITRWRRDPFVSQLTNLQDEMNRRFEGLFSPGGEEPAPRFVPPMDIAENGDGYVVKTEIPGMKPEDIHIDLTGNTLTIKGEKKVEAETKEENYHRIERSFGSFVRRVELPQGVDPERVEAAYDQGVLTVKVSKAEAVKPRQITVKTTSD